MKKRFIGKLSLLMVTLSLAGWALCTFTYIPQEVLHMFVGAFLAIEAVIILHGR